MSVIVEFTIDKDALALGQALAGAGDADIELEQIVPTGNTTIPFFWVDHPDREALEVSVAESEYVENLVPLDTVGHRTLYKVEWTGEYEDLMEGIVQTDGTILEATGDGAWHFVLRFVDHDQVGQFYSFCTDHDLPIHIERTYTLTEGTSSRRTFGLTNEQREALVLALERGYFKTPRDVEMQALADELDISQQAFSERLWGGLEKVLDDIFS